MKFYFFEINKQFKYNWTGRFEALNNEWVHLTRTLIDYELIVVTSGVLYIADADRQYTVNSGEYLLMHPSDIQYGYKNSDCTFYWLHFSYNQGANDIMPKEILAYTKGSHYLDYPGLKDDSIFFPIHGKLNAVNRLIILMKQLQDSDRNYHDSLLNSSLVSTIICELAAQFKYIHNADISTSVQVYNDIIDYINYHIHENLRVIDIAQYFNYNEKYLSAFFKKNSGNTLKQYILMRKMEIAKSQLSDTNNTISQISQNVGFPDSHNFTTAFKKVTGLSPSGYRTGFSKRMTYNK